MAGICSVRMNPESEPKLDPSLARYSFPFPLSPPPMEGSSWGSGRCRHPTRAVHDAVEAAAAAATIPPRVYRRRLLLTEPLPLRLCRIRLLRSSLQVAAAAAIAAEAAASALACASSIAVSASLCAAIGCTPAGSDSISRFARSRVAVSRTTLRPWPCPCSSDPESYVLSPDGGSR